MTARSLTRGSRAALHDETLRAYLAAVRVSDPIRTRFWEEQGVTVAQGRVMISLLEREGQMLSELAEHMKVSPATITGIIDRLVKRGLVERMQDAQDRRVLRASLTPAGERAVRSIQAPAVAFFRRVFDEMGEEKTEALASSLREFAHAARLVTEGGESPS